MSAEVHARALDAIRVRRALIAVGTPGPWEAVRVPFRETASWSVKVGNLVLALVGWEREEPIRSRTDAALIVAAVNAFAADTDALAAVLTHHAPIKAGPFVGWCGHSITVAVGTAWADCPDAAAALRALGVES